MIDSEDVIKQCAGDDPLSVAQAMNFDSLLNRLLQPKSSKRISKGARKEIWRCKEAPKQNTEQLFDIRPLHDCLPKHRVLLVGKFSELGRVIERHCYS